MGLCECNWDIDGVEALPPHIHYAETRTGRRGLLHLFRRKVIAEECIYIHVDWMQLLLDLRDVRGD